jgi:hypothetical protein
MKRKKTLVLESPTIAETLQFIEHEVSQILASVKEDWGRRNTCPDVSISLGCPEYWITPYLHSPSLNNFVDGICRQIGIIPCRDSSRGYSFLRIKTVEEFRCLHRAEILAFLGKIPDAADDEPTESFGGPLVDAARSKGETGVGV